MKNSDFNLNRAIGKSSTSYELLSPAGNLEKLNFALAYGADAVYIGGSCFSLRQAGYNFGLSEIEKAREITKRLNKKLYVAVNIFAHQEDLKKLTNFLVGLVKIKPDALIISDLGVLRVANKVCPDLAFHVSTQANVTNLEAAKSWAQAGAKRVTLARELSLKEVEEITGNLEIETEVFIHGAMCLSYSGRCWLSHHIIGRDANRGDCAQNCRFNYVLLEEKRVQEALSVFEDKRGSYILSSKDLCLAEEIPLLIKAGVRSFKIEGRMKSVHYVATVTKVYRQIIDKIRVSKNFKFDKNWFKELKKISHRHYTKGFIDGEAKDIQVNASTSYFKTAEFVGEVKEQNNGICKIKVKNRIVDGEEIEVLMPVNDNIKSKVQLFNEENKRIIEAHPNEIVFVKAKWPIKSLLRRKI